MGGETYQAARGARKEVLVVPPLRNGAPTSEIAVMHLEERRVWWERVKDSGSLNSSEGRAMRSAVRKESDQLYERFAKPYEEEHYGKFVAIHPCGEMIIAEKSYEVLEEISGRWGDDWCAFRRMGNSPALEWKSAKC